MIFPNINYSGLFVKKKLYIEAFWTYFSLFGLIYAKNHTEFRHFYVKINIFTTFHEISFHY